MIRRGALRINDRVGVRRPLPDDRQHDFGHERKAPHATPCGGRPLTRAQLFRCGSKKAQRALTKQREYEKPPVKLPVAADTTAAHRTTMTMRSKLRGKHLSTPALFCPQSRFCRIPEPPCGSRGIDLCSFPCSAASVYIASCWSYPRYEEKRVKGIVKSEWRKQKVKNHKVLPYSLLVVHFLFSNPSQTSQDKRKLGMP